MPQCLATLCSFHFILRCEFPNESKMEFVFVYNKRISWLQWSRGKRIFKLTFLGRNPNAEAVKYQVLIEPVKKENRKLIIIKALNCVYVYNLFMNLREIFWLIYRAIEQWYRNNNCINILWEICPYYSYAVKWNQNNSVNKAYNLHFQHH